VARELTALCTTATPEPVLRRMLEEGGLSGSQLQRLRGPHLPKSAPTPAAIDVLPGVQARHYDAHDYVPEKRLALKILHAAIEPPRRRRVAR
jgi:hypothetical protein